MEQPRWMIYGANGYTGRLTARLAMLLGENPVLAGRSKEKIEPLAQSLELDYRVFRLDDPFGLKKALESVDAILLMAGPFSATSRLVVDACLQTGTHYLDITGEIAVLETVLNRDEEARKAGVTLIPGVGFDVVPTDCLAAMLAQKLPDATHLELAFGGSGKISPGTMKTIVEGLALPKGGAIRDDGRIKPVRAVWKTRRIPFPNAHSHAISIGWGDVASAYHSTGIPNIVTYMSMPESAIVRMKQAETFQPILKLSFAQSIIKHFIEKWVPGPTENDRRKGFNDVWGEVRNANGQIVTGCLTTPEGYTLTADSSIRAMKKVLEGSVSKGALTPSKAFGADFILECDGVTRHEFTESQTD